MRFRLLVVQNAEREIREAAEWWYENRPSVRGLFREELARGFELITTQPRIGPPALNTQATGLRRLHLGRIHHYLYYRVREEEEAVEVLSRNCLEMGTLWWPSDFGRSHRLLFPQLSYSGVSPQGRFNSPCSYRRREAGAGLQRSVACFL